MTTRAVEVVVRGRVQGVGFRYATVRQASALGLAGWVHNDPDAGVRVWAEGNPASVAALIEWLHDGPTYASVQSVQVTERETAGLTGFGVR